MFNINLENKLDNLLSKLSQSTQVENLVEQLSAKIYKQDVLRWIDSGSAFTNRTYNLRASILAMPESGNFIVSAGNTNTKTRYKGKDANYAELVEFGTERSNPYSYLYADLENRKDHIGQVAGAELQRFLSA